MVKQMIGNDEGVSLLSVYVDLTVVKQKPRPVELEDETVYNEIAYLRKIAKKKLKLTPVGFTEDLGSHETDETEICFLIGNGMRRDNCLSLIDWTSLIRISPLRSYCSTCC